MGIKTVSDRDISSSFFIAIVLVFTLSCSENRKDDFSGNWVSDGFFSDSDFTTLTITDSTITENEFGLNRMDYLIIRDHKGLDIVDAYHLYPAGFTLKKSGDRLIMSNPTDNSEILFSKIDFKKDYVKLLFSDSDLKIELPETQGNTGASIDAKGIWSSLYIGTPKNSKKEEFLTSADSRYQIQFFYNRTLQLKDIPNFINNEKTKVDESDRDKLKIILYADKHTPQAFISSILEAIEKEDEHIKIYRAHLPFEDNRFQYNEIGTN